MPVDGSGWEHIPVTWGLAVGTAVPPAAPRPPPGVRAPRSAGAERAGSGVEQVGQVGEALGARAGRRAPSHLRALIKHLDGQPEWEP